MMSWLKKITNAIKTTDTSNLVTKVEYNVKIGETEKKINAHDHNNKYITTHKFNKFTINNFAARLTQTNLATKNDISNFFFKSIF